MSGRATLLIGVALVIVAASFDSPSLYVPGVAFTLLSVCARVWVRAAARSTSLRRLPGPRSVAEGEAYPLAFEVERGRLPAPGGQLLDPALESPRALAMPLPERISDEARFPRRGRRVLAPARLRIADPLGLREAEIRSGGSVEVLVLPRIEPVIASGAGSASFDQERPEGSERALGSAGLDTGAIEFEVDGLRPYRDGTPASRIHWPTVARTGELVEHKLITGGRASPLVVLDASDPVDETALDKAVRAAASLCFHLARDSGCAILLPGEVRLREVGPAMRVWPRVHARLALVEAGPAPRMRRWPRGEQLFWVTARARPRLPVGAAPAAWASSFLITPNPVAGRGAGFSVAGCTGRRLHAAERESAAAGIEVAA